MTSTDTQTLIEEARKWAALPNFVSGRSVFTRLADALESSEAARRDLTDKIEALTAVATQLLAQWDNEHRANDLRGLVSGDKSGRDIYFDNLRKTAGPRVLAVIDKMQAEERTDG